MNEFKKGDKVWVVVGETMLPGWIEFSFQGNPQVYVDSERFMDNVRDDVYTCSEAAATALRAKALKDQARIESNIAMALMRKPEGWL